MVRALQLGNRLFSNNIIQGPLAGVSCAPFRLLTWRYSQPAFSCTEMISCKTLINQPKFAQQRFVVKDPHEGPVCFQLAASEPGELAEAVKRATDFGADLIDLNCGCPVNKIRKKGAGSSLLTQASKLYAMIRAMKENTHVPVSIKIRVEGGSPDLFNEDVAKAVSDAGADYLIVHGRHWTEHYETPCNYDEIQFFVGAMKIPVIGNGDVKDLQSLRRMLATGCAGVMIARAGVGQPWLIRQLIAEYTSQAFELPPLSEVACIFIEHISRLSDLLQCEKVAILQARKLAKYYGRRLSDRNAFCEAVNVCEALSDLKIISTEYFG